MVIAYDIGSTVTISASDFEVGFFANGTQLSAGYTAGSLTIASGTPLIFDGTYFDLGQTVSSTQNIYVLTSVGDTNAIGKLSISAGTDGAYDNITGTFVSDGSFPVPSDATTVASGSAVSFNFPFDANTLSVTGTAIPEPSSLLLLGASIMTISALGYRRRFYKS